MIVIRELLLQLTEMQEHTNEDQGFLSLEAKVNPVKKLYLLLTALAVSFSSNAQQTIYVNQNAPATGNGTSWATALDSLHEALVLAQSGDEIWVAKGIYTPYLDAQYQVPADPREATFALKKDVSLYGSFTGNETSPSQRNWSLDSTILLGDIGLPRILIMSIMYSRLLIWTVLS